MLIGIPNCQGRVSPVFDVATRLVLIRRRGEAEIERKEVVLFDKEPKQIVRSLGELGIEVLICGGISHELLAALELAGIRVRAQVCGDLEAVIEAYQTGKLNRPEFVMPGCWRRPGQACGAGPGAEGLFIPAGGDKRSICKRSMRERSVMPRGDRMGPLGKRRPSQPKGCFLDGA